MEYHNEYSSPELYDAEYGSFSEDLPFFCSYISKGSVLDLACGTGRLTIALAKTGRTTFGIDENSLMIERAKMKSQGLSIDYRQQDMRSFNMGQTFDLITLAGNSFQALLTRGDQDQLFENVYAHLKPDGLFIFNTRNPTPETERSIKNFEFWHEFMDPNGTPVQVFGKQRYDSKSQITTYTTKRVWPTHATESAIALRFSTLDEIMDALQQHGLNIIQCYGDFKKSLWTKESKNIIVVATKKP
ncbi:MAG: class I SAM-dependent DNA methyltransferase [Candidatus Nucleicultricaceae bacterium]